MPSIERLLGPLGVGLLLFSALACRPATDGEGSPAPASDQDSAGAEALVDGSPSGGTVRLYAVDRYEGVRRLAPDTLEVIDTIDVGPRPHGIVATRDGRTLYITTEVASEVVKVDVASHEILGRAQVGDTPNEPTLSRDERYLFVPIRAGDTNDVVDTETMSLVKSLPAGRAGHNAYTSPDGSLVYSTSMGDNLIAVIDPNALEIVRKIPVGGIPRPVALTRDNKTAHVALSGMIGFITVDLESDEIVGKVDLAIPPGTPVPMLDTYTHGLLLTPDERELWVCAYATNTVYAYLMPEAEELAAVEVEGGPHWLTLHPDGEPLYVSLEASGQVASIHRGVRSVLKVADVGRAPTRILAFRTSVAD